MAVFFNKRSAKIQSLPSRTGSLRSNGSMTQSQLNLAILEMLDLHQNGNKCTSICRGNPITDEGKRKQMLKMLGVVLIPLMVLTAMTANTLFIAVKSYATSAKIRTTILFGTEVGDLLRALQRERDMSTLYVSNLGPKTKQFLLQRYPETDERLTNLSAWPLAKSEKRFQFQTKDIFISHLNQHRYELDLIQPTTKEEILFYTEAIDVFITWIYEAISEAQSGAIWRSLVAYQEIVVTSEYIGRERGVGVIFYARGQFDTRDDYLLFAESQDVANSTYKSAKRYSDIVSEVYGDQARGNDTFLTTVKNMRVEILSNNYTLKPSVENANWWFNNMSKYQDVISVTQNKIVSKIISILWEQSDGDVRTMVLIAGVFCAICIIAVLVVYLVYKSTSQIQTYSVSIANRTKALNKEKRRTETLLHQMLPQSVADRLKRNEGFEAEHFTDASIFFSDIVGFTRISSNSSPLQVVDMLNSLYTCFDERINCFDVYKVETIGDAYMVVSGVPHRNGKRHASEIASMALDLLSHIELLEIPHLPGSKFKLRIGCHSGPVVAGIVGAKMPKYCLFGETVTVASKMESYGKVGRIHISEATHNLLTGLGGFEMKENKGKALQKDKDVQVMYKSMPRTYWLLGYVDDEIASLKSSSDSSQHSFVQQSPEPHETGKAPWI